MSPMAIVAAPSAVLYKMPDVAHHLLFVSGVLFHKDFEIYTQEFVHYTKVCLISLPLGRVRMDALRGVVKKGTA